MIKKVIIASRNPVKLNAVKIGFTKMFAEETFAFEGISVPSEVQDQPLNSSTTFTGALNRANNAMVKMEMQIFGLESRVELNYPALKKCRHSHG